MPAPRPARPRPPDTNTDVASPTISRFIMVPFVAVGHVVAVDEHGDGPAAEEGVRVGLIRHFPLDRADAADRAVVEQAIGEQNRGMDRAPA